MLYTPLFETELAAAICNALAGTLPAGCSAPVGPADIELPPDPKLGDYAYPCFPLAKLLKKPPALIAASLAAAIRLPDFVRSATAAGGYLNFHLDGEAYAQRVYDALAHPPAPQAGGPVLVEYSSPNIAKPFHVGHLMTTLIGDALYRLYSHAGYNVVRINHLGDYGTQFGKLIYAYNQWGDDAALEQDPITELLRIYVLFHTEAKANPALEDSARQHFLALEQGAPEETALWQHFRSLSLREFDKVYHRLGIRFDSCAGESFYSPMLPAVVEELRSKQLLQSSQGAQVVQLEEESLPPCIILKSDGASIYATRDLAAAIYRQQTYHFAKCLYVVGQPQALHFQQVFAVLHRMGCTWASSCEHVGYPHMRFAGGRLSTRSGNVVILEDLLDESVRRAKARMAQSGMAAAQLDATAETVGIGAVKFAFLKNSRSQTTIFDWDEVLDFGGMSGPYIQYAWARCQQLLAKAPAQTARPTPQAGAPPMADAELTVVKNLHAFHAALDAALRTNEPSVMARHVFQLAQAFNRFYGQCPVIGTARQAQRLLLVRQTASQIQLCLGLLGIGVVAQM